MVHVLHIPTPGQLCSCPPFGDSLLSVVLKATALLFGGDGDRVDLFPWSTRVTQELPGYLGACSTNPAYS